MVLHDPRVKGRRTPDYPWARSDDEWRQWLRVVGTDWGKTEFFDRELAEYSPTVADDPDFRTWYARHMRSSASPGAAAAFQRMVMEGDVSSVLPTIHVPTLVLHRPMSSGPAEFVARQIPGAIRREIPGLVDGFSWADPERNQVLLDETRRFLLGLQDASEPDVVLGTFLFTDIVGSTERAAAMGDVAWHALLQRHHALVRARLAQFRGTEVGTAGNGFFATFDGPGRAIRCACAIRDDVRSIGLEIRAGLHTGEGQVHDGQVGGIAVHVAAPGLALEFVDAGVHALNGVPGEWRLYRVHC